jgi:hypothetical protein
MSINDKITKNSGSVPVKDGRPRNYNKNKMSDFGWTDDSADIYPVPKAYRVIVASSALNVKVIGVLQEKTQFTITSEWGSFIPIGGLQNTSNQMAQLFGGRTLMTKWMSRRIWKGTSPISILLDFHFQSITDTKKNVIYPTQALMAMCLPSTASVDLKFNVLGKSADLGSLPLLKAPGPSPFEWKDAADAVKGMGAGQALPGLQGGDKISLSIGKHLFFNSVIVKRVTPIFDTKMDKEGWPISSNVSVEFETYEVITKEDLDDIFFSGGGS